MLALAFGDNFKYKVVHYDVDFGPDKPMTLFRPVMKAVRQKYFRDRYPAFDGIKNLFSATRLPIDDEVHVMTKKHT